MTDNAAMRTRLIIPAPMENYRESGIQWYEVFLPPDDLTPRPRPANPRGMPVLEARQTLEGISANMTHNGSEVQVEGVLTAENGIVRIELSINNQDVVISGDPADVDSITVTGRAQLAPGEQQAAAHWARLDQSFNMLAQAMRRSWGCAACVLASAGVGVAATCCGLAPGPTPCCASTLLGAGTVAGQCGDNPCDLQPVVVQGGLAGT